MDGAERALRAHDLGVAALLGDSIYNFGELLMHPILDALDGSAHEWLKKLLLTFNEGSIGKFEALAPLFPKEVRVRRVRGRARGGAERAQPILQENYPFLRQKICLMALIESVFRRDAYDRTLPFATIATETHLPLDEVEHLLMKALRCAPLHVRGRRES
jgi:26S proteasome regulatory subunit N9